MGKVILVLGGGGVKGMAHAGAWRAIEEAQVPVAEVIGTSIGALVAAMIGAGTGGAELEAHALALAKRDIVGLNRWALLLNGIRQSSIFRAEPLQEYIRGVLPTAEFAGLRIPVSMNAVHLDTGAVEWFGAGGRMDVPLADAVYASCALPVFYPPGEIEGRYYVDGGVQDTLPIGRAAARGAEVVIAVDTTAGAQQDAADTVANGLVAIHHRVYDIMAYAHKRETLAGWAGPRLIYIRPALDGLSTFDFTRTRYFLDEGYRATWAALVEAGLAEGVSGPEMGRTG